MDYEKNENDILKNSESYKYGEAIGNMCISQSLYQKQLSLNTEFIKQSGILNNNFKALGE